MMELMLFLKGHEYLQEYTAIPVLMTLPTELVFGTAYDGANAIVENMSISNAGHVWYIWHRHTSDSSAGDQCFKVINNAEVTKQFLQMLIILA